MVKKEGLLGFTAILENGKTAYISLSATIDVDDLVDLHGEVGGDHLLGSGLNIQPMALQDGRYVGFTFMCKDN